MSYIDRNLLVGETIIFRTRKSTVIFFWPIVVTAVSIYLTQLMLDSNILKNFVFAPWAVAGILWGYNLLEYYTSEYAVTDKRIMMREGFFVRHANETRLTAISQVNVEQSIVGVMLNFGTVSINAFGAFDAYPRISHPFDFQKNVNQQLDLRVK